MELNELPVVGYGVAEAPISFDPLPRPGSLMSIRSNFSSPRAAGQLAGRALACCCLVLTAVLPGQTRPDDVPAALVVRIEGKIGTATAALLHRAIKTVKGNGSQYLVLDIHSFQSEVGEISEAVKLLDDLQDENLSVVAFIAESAFPAATMLALACDQVYMRTGAQIGGGVLSTVADFTSLRGAMVNSIAKTTRDSPGRRLLVQAMVDLEMILWKATYTDDSDSGSGLEQTDIFEDAKLRKMQDNPKIRFAVPPFKFVQPLSLKAHEAEDVGLVDGVVDTIEIVISERLGLDQSQIGYMQSNWSEDIVTWLNQMRQVLFILGFILLLIEFKTPGFALPGILGVMMFGLAFFGSYMVGLASISDVLLFFLGLGLLAIEIYVMPGMIVFGVAGFLCIVAGLIFSQQDFYLPSNATQSQALLDNLINFGLMMVFVMAGIWGVYANLHRIPYLKHAVQNPPEYDLSVGRQAVHEQHLANLAGQEGVLATDLRPAGVMSIGDQRYDVVSEGKFVDEGVRVRVVEVRGNRVVVAPVGTPGQAAGER